MTRCPKVRGSREFPHLPPSITVALLPGGLAALAPATGSAKTALPEISARVTPTRCFPHQMVNEHGKSTRKMC
jgi:hypothetical protein